MASIEAASPEGCPHKKRKITTTSNAPSDRMTQMTLDSLSLAVFGTCELLEGVLSYLPLKDLFILQRVSKQWGKVIAASPQLQEKMFLRLQSKIPQETWVIDNLGKPSISGRPLNGFGVRAGRIDFRLVSTPSSESKRLYMPTTLSPALQILRPCVTTPKRVLGGMHERASLRVHCAELDKHSSLYDMYISDPPCCMVRLRLPIKPKGGSQITSDKGVTVGDILTAASQFKKEYGHWLKEDHPTRIQDLSVFGAESVTLRINLMHNGNPQLVVPSDAERATATADRTSLARGGTAQPLGSII